MNITMRAILVTILGFVAITSRSYDIPEDLQKFAVANHKFTDNIFKLLAQSDADNIVASPLVLQILLALVADSAGGVTRTELKDVLYLELLEQNATSYENLFETITHNQPRNYETFKLLYANKIFFDKRVKIRSIFSEYADEVFKVEVDKVFFFRNGRAADQINEWVSDTTADEIDDLIDPKYLAKNTALVLVNNLYFQWTFKNPFLPKFTKSGVFYTSSTETKIVDYVRSYRNASYGYDPNLKAKFLELPFVNDLDDIYIVFVLPDSRGGIKFIETNAGKYLETQPLQTTPVAIALPKFGFNTEINYKPILQNLGVKSLFDPQLANLTLLTPNVDVAVDKLVQKSKISITETGIEAGATKIAPGGASLGTQPGFETFNADHPFLFYIKHASGGVFLIGKVTDPSDAYKELL